MLDKKNVTNMVSFFREIGFIVIIIVTVSYIFSNFPGYIKYNWKKHLFKIANISAGILTLSLADCTVSGMRLKGRIILYFDRSSWV